MAVTVQAQDVIALFRKAYAEKTAVYAVRGKIWGIWV